jgi:hypothetical protein
MTGQPPSAVTFVLRLDPGRVFVRLLLIIGALAVASTIAVGLLGLAHWPPESLGYELVKLFWLDTEYNVPTLYQFAALALSALLMFVIAREAERPDRQRWYVLGSVFLLLAFDEGLRLHETVADHSSFTFGAAGVLFYAPLLLVLALWWLPLYLRFDSRTKVLFALAAVAYVGGAAGVESLSQYFAAGTGKATPLYVLLATAEETLEMLGIAILIYALLVYLGSARAGRPTPHPARGQGTETNT